MTLATRVAPLFAVALLNACSGGATDYSEDDQAIVFEDDVTEVELNETPFFDDVAAIEGLPRIAYSETLPESGLEVAYTTGLQRDWIDPLFIEDQWMHMLSCTGVALSNPLIMVVEDEAISLDFNDDVIRHIDGRTVASANRNGDKSVIQVSQADFDGTLGTPGFNLRAIIGRYLWLGANLAERDYPFNCTRL